MEAQEHMLKVRLISEMEKVLPTQEPSGDGAVSRWSVLHLDPEAPPLAGNNRKSKFRYVLQDVRIHPRLCCQISLYLHRPWIRQKMGNALPYSWWM